MKHLSELAGNAQVPIYCITDNERVLMIMQDYSRTGYADSTHPEIFNPSNYYYVHGLMAFYAESVLTMQANNTGAVLVTGGFLSNAGPIFTQAYQMGAVSMAFGTGGGQAGPAFMADYQKLSDEHIACGAWADPDPKTAAAVIGSDVAKLISAALVIVFIILAASGVSL
jgi:hypothetical protein